MEVFRQFLETSTIHGLSYISSTRTLSRVFWTSVVIAGFSSAGVMIYQSFSDWEENPITTKIETLPITEVTFPKITVCPPQNTYTNLNFDIVTNGNTNVSEETKRTLVHKLGEKILDLEANYTKDLLFNEKNRSENWYFGYSHESVPNGKRLDDSGYQDSFIIRSLLTRPTSNLEYI